MELGIWLPVVDAFRTLVVDLPDKMRALRQPAREFRVQTVSRSTSK
jgi:hypothetical protein